MIGRHSKSDILPQLAAITVLTKQITINMSTNMTSEMSPL